jgi:Uma2 family endonuclease
MSALSANDRDMGYSGRRLTAEEFFALGETDARLELIDGVITVSPSPFPIHQRYVHEIQWQLESARRRGTPIVVIPDTDLQLASHLVYRADVLVYHADRVPTTPTRLATPPDLVIEVISGGSRGHDLITKRDDYESHGVGEYWAVDPADLRVRAWRRDPAAPDIFTELPFRGTLLPSTAIAGFTLDLAPLRDLK